MIKKELYTQFLGLSSTMAAMQSLLDQVQRYKTEQQRIPFKQKKEMYLEFGALQTKVLHDLQEFKQITDEIRKEFWYFVKEDLIDDPKDK